MTIRATLPLVMAPMFRPFVEQLRRVGSDASAILDRYGITDTMMNDPTIMVSVHDWYAFLADTAQVADDPCFGFRTGNGLGLRVLPNFELVRLKEWTCADVLTALVIDSRRVTTLANYTLTTTATRANLKASRTFRPQGKPAQADGFFTGFMVRLFSDFVGKEWEPNAMTATVSSPAAIPFDGLPSSNIVQGGPEGAMFSFPSMWLTFRFKGAKIQPRLKLASQDHSFLVQFRRMLTQRIDDTDFNLANAAKLASLSASTLQRRLQAAGSSFSAEIESIRATRAKKMLRNVRVPIRKVGEAVGYPDPSTFGRAFKRWTGQTPSAYRRAIVKRVV